MLFCEVLLGADEAGSGAKTWSKMGSNLSHSTLAQLSAVFNILDKVVQEHDAFKVETIGSEYMAVSGKLLSGCNFVRGSPLLSAHMQAFQHLPDTRQIHR